MDAGLVPTEKTVFDTAPWEVVGDIEWLLETVEGLRVPACSLTLIKSRGLPMRIPIAPDMYPAQKSAAMAYEDIGLKLQ
jgi:hypothetical protein